MNKFMSAVIIFVSVMFSGMSFADETRDVEHLNSGKIIPHKVMTEADVRISEAVRVGNILFLSGQLGTIPGTRTLAPGGIKAEAKQSLENIKTNLEAYGYSMSNIVRCTVILADIAEWSEFNEVWGTFFSKPYPGRTTFGGNDLGFGARVEIMCTAAVD